MQSMVKWSDGSSDECGSTLYAVAVKLVTSGSLMDGRFGDGFVTPSMKCSDFNGLFLRSKICSLLC